MTERYHKLTPNRHWKPSANLVNDLVRFAEAARANEGTQTEIDTTPGELRIKNESGAVLSRYSVVGVGDPLALPSVNRAEYLSKKTFRSVDPAPHAPFAILQQGINNGTIGDAFAHGESHCRIYINDTTHEYADAEDENYAYLQSQAAGGQARILYKQIPANTQLDGGISNSALTIAVDSVADWPDPADTDFGPFFIRIDGEELRVTAVDFEADPPEATVQRGANNTTATSHADNAVVRFFKGVVRAKVHLRMGPMTREVEVIQGIPTWSRHFLGTLRRRDPDSEGWIDDEEPIWIVDHNDRDGILHELQVEDAEHDPAFNAHYAKDEAAGPFIAVATSTGVELFDQTKWAAAHSDIDNIRAYVADVVSEVTPANGALTIVANSQPIDFMTTLDVIVEGDDNDINFDLTITDAPSFEVIAVRGTGTYETQRRYSDFTALDISNLEAGAGTYTVRIVLHSYPFGVLRTNGGNTYIQKDPTGTTGVPGVSSDWLSITLANEGEYNSAATYSAGQYVEWTLPVYAIESAVRRVNSVQTTRLTHEVGTAGQDHNIVASFENGTLTLYHNIPDASKFNRGLVTIAAQTFNGFKTFLDQITVDNPDGNIGFQINQETVMGGDDPDVFQLMAQVVPIVGSIAFQLSQEYDDGSAVGNVLLIGKAATPSPTDPEDHALIIAAGGYDGTEQPRFAVREGATIYVGARTTVAGMEFKGGIYISGTPDFGDIAGDLDLATQVTGQLKLENGGTESDLSATGPGITVQANSGDPLTVQQEANIAALTDSTGGTANDTLVAISGTGDDANINDNFADLAAKVNAILSLLQALKAMA